MDWRARTLGRIYLMAVTTLGRSKGIRAIERVIELHVQMMRLISQRGLEREEPRRKAPVSVEQVFAIGRGGGDCLGRVPGDRTLNSPTVVPGGVCRP